MFTLVPGAGFIMCESIGDIDPNVPRPPMSQEVQEQLVEEHCNTDPVFKALGKLGEIYRSTVKPLMHLNYTPDSPESIAAVADQVSNAVSAITEKTSRMIAKMYTTTLIGYQVYGRRYCGDKFYAHVGLFMKNMKTIQQQGYMEKPYQVDQLPFLRGVWEVERALGILAAKPELMDEFIDESMMSVLFGCDRDISTAFTSMYDLLKTFYENSAKLARMERPQNHTLRIEHMLETLGSPNDDIEKCCYGSNTECPAMLRFISSINRKTMQQMYEVQCNMIEGARQVDVSKSITRVVNLFGIITVYVMYMAYQIRDNVVTAKTADQYTDELLALLKTD